jgi:predicted metal-binding membrane protein
MAALFALGVMSVGWMVFIAALIAAEKLLPWKAHANRGIALLLAVLGVAVMLAPEDVPGLTLPDSAEAGQAMEAMGMEGESMSAPAHEDMEGADQKESVGGASMKEDAGRMP